MPYYTNLAEVARRTGFPVVEQPGWRTRGHGNMNIVRSVICHHDAANQAPSTFNKVIQDGHSTLAGPLAHYALRRDGTIHVVAAGLCYHAGKTINDSIYGNSHAIGIEAGNNGVGEPWPAVQLKAYAALCRELAKEFGFGVDRVRGHKEIAAPLGRKIDPAGIDMNWFRSQVAAANLAPTVPPKIEDDMPYISHSLPSQETPNTISIPWENTPGSALATKSWVLLSSAWGKTKFNVYFIGTNGIIQDAMHEYTIAENGQKTITMPSYCLGVQIAYQRIGASSQYGPTAAGVTVAGVK